MAKDQKEIVMKTRILNLMLCVFMVMFGVIGCSKSHEQRLADDAQKIREAQERLARDAEVAARDRAMINQAQTVAQQAAAAQPAQQPQTAQLPGAVGTTTTVTSQTTK
jgi:hypothetical protein